jgi:DNA-binding NarL/FixJ family response regulator
METRDVVLLFWARPGLLSEFERALEGSSFRVEGCRVESTTAQELRHRTLPRTPLYALDGAIPNFATEGLAHRALSRNSGSKALVVAEGFTEATAFPLLRIGVKGLLSYSEIPSRLQWVLAEVFQGGYWVPRGLLSGFVATVLAGAAPKTPPAEVGGLTQREQQVMTNLLKNSSNKEIASRLQISERTAKFHVSNVLAKYGVRRRADLILLAYFPQGDS